MPSLCYCEIVALLLEELELDPEGSPENLVRLTLIDDSLAAQLSDAEFLLEADPELRPELTSVYGRLEELDRRAATLSARWVAGE